MLAALRDGAKRWLIERRHHANLARCRTLGLQQGMHPRNWGAAVSDAGHLLVGGCDVATLAAEFGTPLLVVDRRRLEADFRGFRDGFAAQYPQLDIAYSYKTNPLPAVLSVLNELGALAEVISHFELWLALKLQVPPARIVFNGPGKGREAIELAVCSGVKMINIDSLEEIDTVAWAARSAGRRQNVGVRVVGSVGWAGQFGLSMRDGSAFEAFQRLSRRPQLAPLGLHAHLGTGLRDVAAYLQVADEMTAFARQLRAQLGVRIDYFDFGGGFGVPTVRPFDRWDERLIRNGRPPAPVDAAAAPTPTDFARGVIDIVRRHHPAGDPLLPTVALEPGRALTSSAQCLVLRVMGVKQGQSGTPSVILDGGRNLALPTGYESHELVAATQALKPHVRRYNFYGPLCHPGDCLFTAKSFPAVQPGDPVAIMDAGAYFVPNQTNFSHPRPAAVMVAHGSATLIRRRESFDDIVRRDLVA